MPISGSGFFEKFLITMKPLYSGIGSLCLLNTTPTLLASKKQPRAPHQKRGSSGAGPRTRRALRRIRGGLEEEYSRNLSNSRVSSRILEFIVEFCNTHTNVSLYARSLALHADSGTLIQMSATLIKFCAKFLDLHAHPIREFDLRLSCVVDVVRHYATPLSRRLRPLMGAGNFSPREVRRLCHRNHNKPHKRYLKQRTLIPIFFPTSNEPCFEAALGLRSKLRGPRRSLVFELTINGTVFLK